MYYIVYRYLRTVQDKTWTFMSWRRERNCGSQPEAEFQIPEGVHLLYTVINGNLQRIFGKEWLMITWVHLCAIQPNEPKAKCIPSYCLKPSLLSYIVPET